jgi:excisionase family DNA binding protein
MLPAEALSTEGAVTVKEAAKLLGLHPATVHRMVAAGQIEHYRLGPRGGKIDIPVGAVDAHLESRRVPVRPAAGSTKPPVRRKDEQDWREELEAVTAEIRRLPN